jgi:hypothetical protein
MTVVAGGRENLLHVTWDVQICGDRRVRQLWPDELRARENHSENDHNPSQNPAHFLDLEFPHNFMMLPP